MVVILALRGGTSFESGERSRMYSRKARVLGGGVG